MLPCAFSGGLIYKEDKMIEFRSKTKKEDIVLECLPLEGGGWKGRLIIKNQPCIFREGKKITTKRDVFNLKGDRNELRRFVKISYPKLTEETGY